MSPRKIYEGLIKNNIKHIFNVIFLEKTVLKTIIISIILTLINLFPAQATDKYDMFSKFLDIATSILTQDVAVMVETDFIYYRNHYKQQTRNTAKQYLDHQFQLLQNLFEGLESDETMKLSCQHLEDYTELFRERLPLYVVETRWLSHVQEKWNIGEGQLNGFNISKINEKLIKNYRYLLDLYGQIEIFREDQGTKDILSELDLKETLLIWTLYRTENADRVWVFFAQYYIEAGYGSHFLYELFETVPTIRPKTKIAVLKALSAKKGEAELLVPYLMGMIMKENLNPREMGAILIMLVKNREYLRTEDFLVLIDHMDVMRACTKRYVSKEASSPEIRRKENHYFKLLQDKSVARKNKIDEVYCVNKPLFQNWISELYLTDKFPLYACADGLFALYRSTFNNSEEGGDSLQRLFGYYCLPNLQCVYLLLLNAPRHFDRDMIVVNHLFYRHIQQKAIRDHLMNSWVKGVESRDKYISLSQLETLAYQAHALQENTLAIRLADRASHLLALPQVVKKPMITFVAGDQSCGDGYTPETLDYFKGQAFVQSREIVREVIRRGFDYQVISWKSPTFDWKQPKMLSMITPWGYSQESADFMTWLDKIKLCGVPVINPMDFIRWSLKKTYLQDLQEEEIPVVPTLIVDTQCDRTFQQVLDQAEQQFGTSNIILKGIIGAGGFDYFHYKVGLEKEAEAHLKKLQQAHEGVVIQPFWEEFSKKGELSFVIVRGVPLYLFWKICAPKGELVQVFYGGRSFHLNKEDLSDDWTEFYRKIKDFNPDIEMSQHEMQGACGQVYKLLLNLRKFYRQRQISEPPIFRLDVVVRSVENQIQLVIGEIEGIDPYLELKETTYSKLAVKLYVDELLRLYSFYKKEK